MLVAAIAAAVCNVTVRATTSNDMPVVAKAYARGGAAVAAASMLVPTV